MLFGFTEDEILLTPPNHWLPCVTSLNLLRDKDLWFSQCGCHLFESLKPVRRASIGRISTSVVTPAIKLEHCLQIAFGGAIAPGGGPLCGLVGEIREMRHHHDQHCPPSLPSPVNQDSRRRHGLLQNLGRTQRTL
ncbi:hypothetical protein NL676_019374 [Syzygium grande]|nr:hypothetical protein NL676_019374 [Syzygium grande]